MTHDIDILAQENELFKKMANGDQSAFELIFRHYSKKVWSFVFKKTRSAYDSEEIVQEIFLKIWKNRAHFGQIENPSAYLFTMAANSIYTWFKNAAADKQMMKLLWGKIQLLDDTTSEQIDVKETGLLIEKAINSLPPQRKKIYLLSRVQGFSHQQIASLLDLSPSSVNNQLSTALKNIREYLNNSQNIRLITIATMFYLLD